MKPQDFSKLEQEIKDVQEKLDEIERLKALAAKLAIKKSYVTSKPKPFSEIRDFSL